jgi:ATP-dependent protease ClpP protease subunit
LIGRCSSSAPIVSLGADHRVIAPDASVLLHRPRLVWTREKAAQLRTLPEEKRHALADCLFAMEAALAGIIADRTGSDASTAGQC